MGGVVMSYLILSILVGGIALGFALLLYFDIIKKNVGSEKMKEISKNIEDGAMTFLFREYKFILIFVSVVAIIITIAIHYKTAVAFVLGAFLPCSLDCSSGLSSGAGCLFGVSFSCCL